MMCTCKARSANSMEDRLESRSVSKFAITGTCQIEVYIPCCTRVGTKSLLSSTFSLPLGVHIHFCLRRYCLVLPKTHQRPFSNHHHHARSRLIPFPVERSRLLTVLLEAFLFLKSQSFPYDALQVRYPFGD